MSVNIFHKYNYYLTILLSAHYLYRVRAFLLGNRKIFAAKEKRVIETQSLNYSLINVLSK